MKLDPSPIPELGLMDKEGNITKIDKILIDQPADSTWPLPWSTNF